MKEIKQCIQTNLFNSQEAIYNYYSVDYVYKNTQRFLIYTLTQLWIKTPQNSFIAKTEGIDV